MSSETYSTELRPEPRLRRLVLGTGAAAAVVAAAMIMALPVVLPARLAAALGWLAAYAIRLQAIRRSYQCCRRIRLEHTGRVLVYTPNECCVPATLLAGSVVLGGFAWLRFQSEDGRRGAEFLRGESRQCEQWRRLQVIWRHLGAAD